ncbi:hypothetical protein JBF11_03410 [Taurinivorans muris]|uniref:Uncharacterized protein n=1 Tax=Taurinivorans muris TaxID=2787751 RepID=A0ABY5Y2Z2_9BACT|nr:hypothetical protein JBF11_03410 [Desulfovibrionaceae bacterium LT0009]
MNINKDFDDFVNKKTEQTKNESEPDFFDKMFDEAFDAEIQLCIIYETLGKDFVLALVENTKRARAKHPTFAYYEEQKLEILQEEYEEVRQAFYTETLERTKEELLDVGTVLARWYGNE